MTNVTFCSTRAGTVFLRFFGFIADAGVCVGREISRVEHGESDVSSVLRPIMSAAYRCVIGGVL